MNGATAWPCILLLRAFEHITAICLHSYVGASPGYEATMDVLASFVLARVDSSTPEQKLHIRCKLENATRASIIVLRSQQAKV